MKFLTELITRWQQDSPPFFIKMQQIGVWLMVTGGGLAGIPAAFNAVMPSANFDLSLLFKIATYMVLSGFIIKIVARTPVIDANKI